MQRSLIYCCLNVQPLKAALPAAQLGAGQLSTALPVRQRDGSTYPFRLPELRSITCCALGTQLIMGVIDAQVVSSLEPCTPPATALGFYRPKAVIAPSPNRIWPARPFMM